MHRRYPPISIGISWATAHQNKTGDSSGTTEHLSTEIGPGPVLSPCARQRQQGAVHRVWCGASGCQAKAKITCPQKMPPSTTTTMYL